MSSVISLGINMKLIMNFGNIKKDVEVLVMLTCNYLYIVSSVISLGINLKLIMNFGNIKKDQRDLVQNGSTI